MGIIARSLLVLASVLAGASVATPDQCPIAIFNCEKVPDNETKYICRASYSHVPNHPGELKWKVSDGKIKGNRKSLELNIDTTRSKSKTITVTLKVHWKNFYRICDRTVTDTIELR